MVISQCKTEVTMQFTFLRFPQVPDHPETRAYRVVVRDTKHYTAEDTLTLPLISFVTVGKKKEKIKLID